MSTATNPGPRRFCVSPPRTCRDSTLLLVFGGRSYGRTATAAGVPERQKFHLPRDRHDSVREIVVNPGEVHATHSNERRVASSRADSWLKGDQGRCAFKFFANSVRR